MPQCENFDFKDTNFSELKNIIKSHNAPNAIIVLSGGEPLLHQKNADFKDFYNTKPWYKIESVCAQGSFLSAQL